MLISPNKQGKIILLIIISIILIIAFIAYRYRKNISNNYKKIVLTDDSNSSKINYNDIKFCTINTCGFTAKYVTDFIDNIQD